MNTELVLACVKRRLLAAELARNAGPFSFRAAMRGVYARAGNIIWVRF